MTDETAKAGSPAGSPPAPSPLKLLLEIGPLILFFVVYRYAGIFTATAVFIPVTIAALVASRYVFGRVGILPLVTGVFVIVFGGLTLWLADDTFIKMKPTLVYLLFAAAALVGLAFNWIVWKQLFGEVFSLTEEGWRKMQLRWGCFFLGMAVLNEIIWRTLSTDLWVSFKVFGVLPLTFIFMLLQAPLLSRYALGESSANSNTSPTNDADGTS